MSKTKTLVTLGATALAALFVASSSIEPALAAHAHGSYSGGGGVKSYSGGSYSGRRSSSGGTHQFSRTYRSPSVGSSKVYAYRSDPGHHHRHHFRGRGFVAGYPYVDDDYSAYSDSCEWLHRRALASGSSYWWNRYYDCINDY
jgi:hypothetical protein